jgi:hypothetical protein
MDRYKDFELDVIHNCKELLAEYGFEYNATIFENDGINPLVIENHFCSIHYNTDGYYGHLISAFYLKKLCSEEKIEIRDYLGEFFLGIDIVTINRYYTQFGIIEGENQRVRIIEALKRNAKKILHFKESFIFGIYTYEMFLEWKTFIEANYNMKRDKYSIPSYDEYLKIR